MIMLSDNRGTLPKRLESDRESLPFPTGGVFGTAAAQATPTLDPDLADDIIDTIDQMQENLDKVEEAMNAELARELTEQIDIAGKIGDDDPDDWPPTAA